MRNCTMICTVLVNSTMNSDTYQSFLKWREIKKEFTFFTSCRDLNGDILQLFSVTVVVFMSIKLACTRYSICASNVVWN